MDCRSLHMFVGRRIPRQRPLSLKIQRHYSGSLSLRADSCSPSIRVALVLARTSRGLLLGEAASPKSWRAIKQAIESHPNVVRVIELLTMHLAPRQILINAHVNLRDDLVTSDIERTNEEIECLIKEAEPRVEMIFLETARASHSSRVECVPEHV